MKDAHSRVDNRLSLTPEEVEELKKAADWISKECFTKKPTFIITDSDEIIELFEKGEL